MGITITITLTGWDRHVIANSQRDWDEPINYTPADEEACATWCQDVIAIAIDQTAERRELL